MKTTGIIRRFDSLGRIVVPKEFRDTLGFDHKTPLEVSMLGDTITIKRHSESCIFCGGTTEIGKVLDKAVCKYCHTVLNLPLK